MNAFNLFSGVACVLIGWAWGDPAAPGLKLAAGALAAMNPHYHPYSELSSPHPPSPDGGPYPSLNGHPPAGYAPHPHHASQHHGQHHGQHHLPPHHNNNNSPALKHCAGCGGKIVERFLLHALDRYWHNGCLKCTCCGAMLAEIGTSCFTKGGMILCKTDYTRWVIFVLLSIRGDSLWFVVSMSMRHCWRDAWSGACVSFPFSVVRYLKKIRMSDLSVKIIIGLIMWSVERNMKSLLQLV